MKVEQFNKILKSALDRKESLLDNFNCICNGFNSCDTKMVKSACHALIDFCQEHGKRYQLDLKVLAGKTLDKKAAEYSCEGNRLWNFFPDYPFLDGSKGMDLLKGYLLKHMVSCADILKGRIDPTQSLVLDKFGDCLNYSILMLAVIEQEYPDRM
jgi:hypothetical protein